MQLAMGALIQLTLLLSVFDVNDSKNNRNTKRDEWANRPQRQKQPAEPHYKKRDEHQEHAGLGTRGRFTR